MLPRMKPAVLALCLAGVMAPAFAGLTGLKVLSQPGEPFEAEIAVVDEELDSGTTVTLADRNRYPQLGVYSAGSAGLRFLLQKNARGDAVIRVRGPAQFDESLLRFAVDVSWSSGRLVREYQFDPRRGATHQRPEPAAPEEGKTKKHAVMPDPGMRGPAMALGEVHVESALGEPLQAKIELLGQNLHKGALSVHLDPDPALGGAALGKVETVWLRRGARAATLLVKTKRPVNELMLGFDLSVQHGGQKVQRRYSMLLDPASSHQQAAPAVAAKGVKAARAKPEIAAQEPVLKKEHAAPQVDAPVSRVPKASGATAPAKVKVKVMLKRYQVREGDTLSSLLDRLHKAPDAAKAMRWMVDNNPEAFINDDANHMKSGATLRFPASWGSLSKRSREAEAAAQAIPVAEVTTLAGVASPVAQVAPIAQASAAPAKPASTPAPVPAPAAVSAESELPDAAPQAEATVQPVSSDTLTQKVQEAQLRARLAEQERQLQRVDETARRLERQLQRLASGEAVSVEEGSTLLERLGDSKTVGGLAALGGLAGLMVLINLRRRRHDGESPLPDSIMNLGAAPFITTAPTMMQHSQLSPLTDLMPQRSGALETSAVDRLAEAEVYLSYGRHDLAMESLYIGIAEAPQRADLRLKLLQMLAQLKDQPAFLREAQAVRDVFGDAHPIWPNVLTLAAAAWPDLPVQAETNPGHASADEPTVIEFDPAPLPTLKSATVLVHHAGAQAAAQDDFGGPSTLMPGHA